MAAVPDLSTETHIYTMNDDETLIKSCTDPAGLWHAGVAATVWDCSMVMSKHFERIFSSLEGHDVVASNQQVSALISKRDLNILELGAGCSALPSMVLVHLFRAQHAGSRFCVTDKHSAMPLLRQSMLLRADDTKVDVEELDWSHQLPKQMTSRHWDLVIACDLLAFPELYQPLNTTLKTLCTKDTLLYIAYERRNFEAEIEFFRELGSTFKFEMVPETELDSVWRAPGEVYLYRAWLR